MEQVSIMRLGRTEALEYACNHLTQMGFPVGQAGTYLLLPVPSFESDGRIKGGGNLEQLPEGTTVIGGNLDCPALAPYAKIDLLQDPIYVAKNAAITAHCAIRLAISQLPCTLEDCPALVIGWGRIGKCLARLLRQLDAQVTVAARKEADRATAAALGYRVTPCHSIQPEAYRVIFNTAPHLLLPNCQAPSLKIDLASQPGITGPDVIWARGLPSKFAPESSGALIAQTVARYLKEETV